MTNWQSAIGNEFAPGANDWPNELSRRKFLQLMGASIALASTGCTRNPPEHIVPYVKQPEEIIPGKPLFYATALTLGGFARGVLIETHEGHPTKIEGNPDHPASVGASDVFMQAELLTLFDPDRSQAVLHEKQISTWDALVGELTAAGPKWKTDGGAALRILTRHETSPTFLDQIRRLLAKYPAAKWHEYEPLARASTAIYHFDKAEVVVSLGTDFLCDSAAGLRYTRDFAQARRAANRLYVAESTPTLTGAMADHRFIMSPDELGQFARDLESGSGSLKAIADDLRAHAGRCVVVADVLEPIARRINDALDNTGTTVEYIAQQPAGRDLRELVDEIRAGAVETLIIISGNPAYDAPTNFEFAQLLQRIPRTIHLDLYANETAELCHWYIPEAHALESWSDSRAFDGTASILQPVIEPLFAGRSRHELLGAILEDAPTTSYEIVRAFWHGQHPAPDFENVWRKSVHDGVVANSGRAGPPQAAATPTLPSNVGAPSGHALPLNLLIRPSAQTYDGRFANNAWLQEFPEPFTTIVWDNAALVSPRTAKGLNLENGNVVNLTVRGRSVRTPIWILPGQADDCVTIHVGYGRMRAGSVGNNVGFNAYQLRTSDGVGGG
ncbi:MAG: molybdopterin oxidoreductase, partial [Chthoniobacterales bacterium]